MIEEAVRSKYGSVAASGLSSDQAGTAPGANTPELLERLADLVRRYEVNDYAASVKVFALKP